MADEEAEFEILSEEGETPDEHDLQILETLEELGVAIASAVESSETARSKQLRAENVPR